ncbi:MAG: hypothetical protein M0C28_00755 [Candidatus Moduliflexus flocculans]|nr:hypothetical protein [Candidatus Moduliflexus flocculans]
MPFRLIFAYNNKQIYSTDSGLRVPLRRSARRSTGRFLRSRRNDTVRTSGRSPLWPLAALAAPGSTPRRPARSA